MRAGLGLGKSHISTVHFNAPRGHSVTQSSVIPLAVHIRRQTESTRITDNDTSMEVDEVVSISEKGKVNVVAVDSASVV